MASNQVAGSVPAIEWPSEIYFRRSINDALVVHGYPTPAEDAMPIISISQFSDKPPSAASYEEITQVYVGSSNGSLVSDLRTGSDDESVSTVFINPPLLKVVNKKANNPAKEQKFHFQASRSGARVLDYTTHDKTAANKDQNVEASFQMDQVWFRWIFDPSFSSVPGSPTRTTTHNLQFTTESPAAKNFTVNRSLFYSAFATENKGTKNVNPMFVTGKFELDKLTWPNFHQNQLTVILSTLWSVWMGDVLNREGALKDLLLVRDKKFKKEHGGDKFISAFYFGGFQLNGADKPSHKS
ncbi:hypothetical protein BCR33DRAFT_715493 [Rhizoclosmatium globosum]|uniref:Uncharacterized protein n=1 Tax=Rhizoclosmatium globosum TaxID=329046 RepID=A0A1Y2CHK8_9FUNG|nr:hypothetical protein BCR33DRAFT_715493 [Rhizoclosmatium globosum]|eukprot:ORY46397.1 hypothetical protein BCR33DRAFT_715493 [Rhizoclosmatium globosum]